MLSIRGNYCFHSIFRTASLAPLALFRRSVMIDSSVSFVDKLRVQVIGGRGGKGVVSFENVDPWKRRPVGGNGGRGGTVLIEASKSVHDLSVGGFVFRGGDGRNATGNKGSTGRNGTDTTIFVPVGTIVREVSRSFVVDAEEAVLQLDEEEQQRRERALWNDFTSKESLYSDTINPSVEDVDKLRSRRAAGENLTIPDEKRLSEKRSKLMVAKSGLAYKETVEFLADLDSVGSRILVARGGSPGLGNSGSLLTFSEQRNESNQGHVQGGKGESRFIELELKSLADVGLVGFPNAGKSSFLAAVSKAKPKIAEYPFTTMHPHVGSVMFNDKEQITIADVPGLIEGAHADRGLGHDFLRHIERTRVLAYVVDCSPDNRDPVGDLRSLQAELKLYNPKMTQKMSIVLANKCDHEKSRESVALLRKSTTLAVMEVSAVTRRGISEAVGLLRWLVDTFKKQEDGKLM